MSSASVDPISMSVAWALSVVAHPLVLCILGRLQNLQIEESKGCASFEGFTGNDSPSCFLEFDPNRGREEEMRSPVSMGCISRRSRQKQGGSVCMVNVAPLPAFPEARPPVDLSGSDTRALEQFLMCLFARRLSFQSQRLQWRRYVWASRGFQRQRRIQSDTLDHRADRAQSLIMMGAMRLREYHTGNTTHVGSVAQPSPTNNCSTLPENHVPETLFSLDVDLFDEVAQRARQG